MWVIVLSKASIIAAFFTIFLIIFGMFYYYERTFGYPDDAHTVKIKVGETKIVQGFSVKYIGYGVKYRDSVRIVYGTFQINEKVVDIELGETRTIYETAFKLVYLSHEQAKLAVFESEKVSFYNSTGIASIVAFVLILVTTAFIVWRKLRR